MQNNRSISYENSAENGELDIVIFVLIWILVMCPIWFFVGAAFGTYGGEGDPAATGIGALTGLVWSVLILGMILIAGLTKDEENKEY